MIRFKAILFVLISLSAFSVLGQQGSAKSPEPNTCEEELKRAEWILADAQSKVVRSTYLLKAHQLAERSLSIKDSELSRLLAIQATNFNKQHNGYNFDSKIFEALYHALETAKKLPIKSNSKDFIESKPFSKTEANKQYVLSMILENQKFEVGNMWRSQSGNFLVANSSDLSIRIWNLKEMSQAPLLLRVGQPAQKVFFSKDESEIGVWVDSNTLLVWPLNSDILSSDLCRLVTRNLSNIEWEFYVASEMEYERTCQR